MPFTFSDDDFARLADTLGVEPKRDGSVVRFELSDEESGRRLVLEIQPAVDLPPNIADADTPTDPIARLRADQHLGPVVERHGPVTVEPAADPSRSMG